MAEMEWKTAVAGQIGAETVIRGYPLTELIGSVSFAEAIFLVLKGETPTEREKKLLEATLVAVIEHGIAPPSIVAARMVLSGGNSINSAVAAGALTLGDFHGGAIEMLAKILQESLTPDVDNVRSLAKRIVHEFKEKNQRVPGFGHKLYKRDPRALKLIQIARDLGFKGKYIDFALAIQDELEADSKGKPLPLNVDGVTAAIMSEMGIHWRNGTGLFIIGRIPGVVAHVVEEKMREKPFRRLPEGSHKYDGKPIRHLTEKK
ncbi:MAG: citryl-CoA lyase [Nitrospirae bacterium]|nr:citryl-CoA lyase [Nitrospirota bacterium]MBI3351940.1 citryl-CoA lyase [Nitrospirota bacterium]